MANPKIPQGYQGTYAHAADGSATLIMVSRSDSITDYTEKKEHKAMSNQPANAQTTNTGEQSHGQFTPFTTEQKKEYAKQFTAREKASYRQGQKNAYGHMANIGKRHSLYIHGNMQHDEAATQQSAPPAESKPKGSRKNSSNKNN